MKFVLYQGEIVSWVFTYSLYIKPGELATANAYAKAYVQNCFVLCCSRGVMNAELDQFPEISDWESLGWEL